MSSESTNVAEILLQKRARRRLVGAIALMLLLVVLLPIVMQDRASLVEKQSESAVKIEMAEALAVEPVLTQEEKAVDVSVPPPAGDVAVENIPATVEKEVKEVEVKPEVKAVGQFFVQIGVFSNMTKVSQLQEKLKQAGYASRVEKIETKDGEKLRLRTDGFPTKQEAMNAQTQLKAVGFSNMYIRQE